MNLGNCKLRFCRFPFHATCHFAIHLRKWSNCSRPHCKSFFLVDSGLIRRCLQKWQNCLAKLTCQLRVFYHLLSSLGTRFHCRIQFTDLYRSVLPFIKTFSFVNASFYILELIIMSALDKLGSIVNILEERKKSTKDLS